MTERKFLWPIALAATLVVGIASGSLATLGATSGRIDALEAAVADLEPDVATLRADGLVMSASLGAARNGVERIENGVARITLTDALEPPSIFGGIQAFVETGTTAHGCIASVSETNVGDLGPFYVLCTPRGPVIDGTRRAGVLLQIRTADAGGQRGDMFPSWAIIEITLWQPGATFYRPPVPCVIGAKDQC